MIEPKPLWYIVNDMRSAVDGCGCHDLSKPDFRCEACRERERWSGKLAEQILAWENRIGGWDVLSKKVAITGILGSWKKR